MRKVGKDEIIKMAGNLDHIPWHPDERFYKALYYKFIRVFCKQVKPAFCVELGVATGGGSMHMAMGNPDAKILGIDFSTKWSALRANILEQYPNIDYWMTDTLSAAGFIPERYENFEGIDLLFIDASHTYKMIMYEFTAYSGLLAENAVIFMDDIIEEEVLKAFHDIPGKDKVSLNHLHWAGAGAGGFGVILT